MPDNNLEKKAVKRTGLGRGIGSLLGENSFDEGPNETKKDEFEIKPITSAPPIANTKSENIKDTARIWQVRIDKLEANKLQPRKVFDKEPLENLAQSIREKGILQPITCEKNSDGSFQIIAGERRWRAAQMAGLQEVPVILRDTDEQDTLELALIENIQRQDLNPIEEAEAYFHLIKKYKMTQQQLSEKVGKDRVTIANVLRLLNLSPEVRKMVSAKQLSMGQAKTLVSISDPKEQLSVAKKAEKQSLSVRALEKLVAKVKHSENSPSQQAEADRVQTKLVQGLGEELQKILGTKVSIDYNQGRGKISMKFYSDNELNQIVDKIREAWQK